MDKITQLENTFKVKIELLSARVKDLETNNDSLLAENLKLKNDSQNLKQQQKGTNKRLDHLEATTKDNTLVNAAPDVDTDSAADNHSMSNNPFKN